MTIQDWIAGRKKATSLGPRPDTKALDALAVAVDALKKVIERDETYMECSSSIPATEALAEIARILGVEK